jgi:hypothetical protein
LSAEQRCVVEEGTTFDGMVWLQLLLQLKVYGAALCEVAQHRSHYILQHNWRLISASCVTNLMLV